MSDCVRCGKSVTRYVVMDGRVVCHECSELAVHHRDGFRFNGSAVPTIKDHYRNLGMEPPARKLVALERMHMRQCERHGGSVRMAPCYQRHLKRAVAANMTAHRAGKL